jgi:hypothetical protein
MDIFFMVFSDKTPSQGWDNSLLARSKRESAPQDQAGDQWRLPRLTVGLGDGSKKLGPSGSAWPDRSDP